MEQKLYTYGNFPFGLGYNGIGPILEEEEESMLVKYNTGGQKIYTSLTQYGDVILTSAATIDVGDVQVSIDDGAFQNIASLPVVNNSRITISLSAPETTCQQVQIRFQDQTNPPEWNDKVIGVETYGDPSAYLTDTFDNNVVIDATNLATSAQLAIVNSNVLGTSAAVKLIPIDNNGITVSASNFVSTDISSLATSAQAVTINNAVGLIPTDNNGITVSASNFTFTDISSLATSAVQADILTGVNGLIVDVMYDPDHALSALDYKITQTNIAVGLIPTDNNGITVSASNFTSTDISSITSATDYLISQIDNTTYGLSAIKAKTDVLVSDILGSDIDSLRLDDALARILSWSTGKIVVAGDIFNYYKQDGSTPYFSLSAADSSRTRL